MRGAYLVPPIGTGLRGMHTAAPRRAAQQEQHKPTAHRTAPHTAPHSKLGAIFTAAAEHAKIVAMKHAPAQERSVPFLHEPFAQMPA